MRRQEFRSERERALSFLGRAEVVRLSTTTPDGEPLLRTLNAVVDQDHLLFHGAKAGEKSLAIFTRLRLFIDRDDAGAQRCQRGRVERLSPEATSRASCVARS